MLEQLEHSLSPLRHTRNQLQSQLESLRSEQAGERDRHAGLGAEGLVMNERLAALDRKPPAPASAAAQAAALARDLLGFEPATLGDSLIVETGYEKAVEAALGLGLYALVVPDWEAALRLASGRGRQEQSNSVTAVFLPASAPALAPAPVHAGEAVPDGLEVLATRVKDGGGARQGPGFAAAGGLSLAAALLSGVAVTDSLEAAAEVMRLHPSLTAAVTRDGRTVTRGGFVYDGPPLLQAGPVSTRREREAVAKEVERLAALRAESAARLKKHAALEDSLTRQAKEAAAALAGAEAELKRETAAVARWAEALAAIKARRQVLSEEQDRVSGEHINLLASIERLEGQLASAAEKTAALNAELAAATQDWARADSDCRKSETEYGQLRVEGARAQEADRAARERRRQLAAEFDSLERELASARARHQEIASTLRQTIEALDGEQRALEDCAASRALQDRESLRLQGEVAAAEETAAGLTRQSREMAAANTALEGRGHRLELLIERLAGEERSLAIAQKSLHPRFASLGPAAHSDPDMLQARAAELTAQLTELGQVDLGASEQYRRLNERLQFLLQQQTELQESSAALRSGANELEREMARRFQECFERIRGEFRTTFAGLFGGGEADLRLVDPDDPLGSGVEIYAQPPGKRMASLALLSGGERALTAIALLFALSGSPVHGFSVLDEVDAYLDEPNCARFGRYLRSLAAGRQFLVITHNKGTMEAADVLYGLTMEEHGVSRVISVRLDQAAATKEATG
jgi:chromosome segregation protein